MKQVISIQTLTPLNVGACVLQHHVPVSDAASVRGGVANGNNAGVFEAGFDDKPDHHEQLGHEQFHDALEDHVGLMAIAIIITMTVTMIMITGS
jgi:hypothetical protein